MYLIPDPSTGVRTRIARRPSPSASLPTAGRGGLARLLPLIIGQAEEIQRNHPEQFLVDVLIVDDDPAESALTVWGSLASPTVRYVVEPEPGVAAVRNRILDEAAASDVIVMIDDDEWPRPGWLSALLHTWLADRPHRLPAEWSRSSTGP